jgi:hypothetical protein
MTQDDTFAKLRRIPFKQMHTLWREYDSHALPDNFYEQYGWTVAEFWDECDKIYNDRG